MSAISPFSCDKTLSQNYCLSFCSATNLQTAPKLFFASAFSWYRARETLRFSCLSISSVTIFLATCAASPQITSWYERVEPIETPDESLVVMVGKIIGHGERRARLPLFARIKCLAKLVLLTLVHRLPEFRIVVES